MLRRLALLCVLLCAVSCSPKTPLRQKAATIDVGPNPILFQPLAVGKTAAVTVQVKNVGNIDLHLAKDPYVVELDNDGLVEYDTPAMLARDCAGASRAADTHLTIVPGDCAVLVLRYGPQNTTDKDDAKLVFESDDPDHPTLSVPVGQGEPPHLQVCTIKADGSDDACDTPQTQPPQIEFDMVAAGQSKTSKVRLKNAGTVPLGSLIVYDPAGLMGAEFARSANAPTTLAVGGSVEITVKFTPAGGGARTGSMQVDSADPTRPTVQIPLRGVRAGPALCVDPSPLDFGKGTVGSAADKTVTLTSCGNATVNLQQTAFDVLSSPAFTSPALPGSQALGVGQKISFTVHFAPDDAADQRGAILLPNDAQADQYLTLLGSAVLPPTCHLEASVSSVSFGQVVRGQSAQRTVTVANRGAADCSLTAVKISAGSPLFSVLSPPTSAVTLRPGDAFTAIVSYMPPAADTNATDSGTLEFDSNDPLRPALSVTLTGSPVAEPVCTVSVSPTATGFGGFGGRVLQFGNVVVGKTKTLPITITNIGSSNCTIGGLKFVNGFGSLGGTVCLGGTSCGEYKVVAPNLLSPLPPGQTTQINIAFSPTDTNQLPQLPSVYLNFHGGDATATSECSGNFPSDNSGGCIDVGMSGQGDISNLEVIPSDVNFGLVTLGCKSRTQTVSLYNTGNATPIHVQGITLDPAAAPFYLQAPPTPFTINAGQKISLQVTYKPSQAAVETATLKIQNDASNTTSNNPYVTVGLKGTGTTDKHQVDSFAQATVPKVDLLFVIDDSGSFGFYQDQLSQQASKFIDAALKYNADYQIGVSANDVVDRAAGSDASYSGTIYVGGLYGQPGIVINTTAPSPSTAFSKNVKIGTNGTAQREAGLELARDVLSAPANQKDPSQGSKGFLRDDARLVVIDVQDDDDESNGSTGYFIDFFKNLKGQYNAGLVSFNAIGGFDDTGQPAPASCNTTDPQAAQRYFDVALATRGKTWNLCNADWSAIADELALGAFQGRKQFPLSRYADPATVVVTLNGAAQTAPGNYVFDQPSNSVIFAQVPPAGATIVVSYDALCL